MDMDAGSDRDDSETREPSSLGSSAGSAFCNLERDYAKIINEMKSNEALATYEPEYTRLFEALYEARRTEDSLVEKCRNLQEQVIDKTSKSYELDKIVESHEETITKLKQEIVRGSRLTDAAHTREQNAQEVIENLRLTITKLNHELELKNKKLAMDEETNVTKQKEGTTKDRERMSNELDTLRQRLKNMSSYTEELEKKTSELEQQISEMLENLDMLRNEISKERTIRDRLEKEVLQLEEEIKLKEKQHETASASIKSLSSNVTKLENSVREHKMANEKSQKEVNKLMVKRMNLQTQLDAANARIEELDKVITERSKENRTLSNEVKRTRDENDKLKGEKDLTLKKIARIDSVKERIEKDLEHVGISFKNSEFEVGSLRRQVEDQKKAIISAVREKDGFAKIITGLKEKLKRIQHEMTAFEQEKRKIEGELEATMQDMNDMRNKVHRVEAERDRLHEESQELGRKVEDRTNVLKLKQVEILDYKKQLMEADTKFRQQQNIFETVRAERNTCGKSLIEAQDEIQNLKSKLKITNHQIEQLKEDVSTKESNLAKQEFLLGKADKEKDNLKAELNSLMKDASELRKEIDEGKQEEKRLRQRIQIADMDVSRLKKDIDTVMNERDILGAQLVRRNDELSLQYSRIKILNGTIQRGEAQYGQRLDDIRLLKLEVKKLRTEKVLLSKSIKNTSDLRHEIFHLERELTNERLKVMALEEEVQNPLNIHRWRKLEGTDPDTFELLRKIQILQKRVLKMSAEIICKEKMIKEREKLYINLRRELLKYPEPRVVASLKETRKALRERSEKIKSLLAELNMYECQSNEYKYDFERLNRELRDIKSKYHAQKRKERKTKEWEKKKEQSTSEPILPAIQPYQKKFCGGGFSMAVVTPRNCYSLESTHK